MLLPPHPHLSYCPATASVPGLAASNVSGLLVTSSASANTYGSWTQLHAGLTYPSLYMIFRVAGVRTSGDVVSATTLNAWIDIGIGPDSSNVTVIAEKIGCPNAQGFGAVYFLPLLVPRNTPIWVRHQNTAASAKSYVFASFFGGNMNPGTFPSVTGIVALGATAASTTGTTITPGASNAEGAWTQIVASSAEEYAGLMLSPLFNVDTTMTTQLCNAGDVGFGASGQEDSVGENVMLSQIWSGSEQRESVHFPTFCGIPAGSRIVARVSGSTTADSSNSIIVYGFKH